MVSIYNIIPATTIHALDRYLDPFLSLTATLQLGQTPSGPGSTSGSSRGHRDNSMEENLLKR